MGIRQAKKIIRICIEWNFWLLGVCDKPTEELDPKTTLDDLIKANKCIKRWNKRQREKYRGTGQSFIQHQTLVDRLIAGIYTALSYSPDGEAKAVINGIGVGLVVMKEHND